MSEHMELEPMSPEWTCAVAVRLVNLGWFQAGEDRYAKADKIFGITEELGVLSLLRSWRIRRARKAA